MLIQQLNEKIAQAVHQVANELDFNLPEKGLLRVQAAADLRHGDYQWNGAMPLAKIASKNPRELATAIIEKLELQDLAETEIAGPGFINFRISQSAWASQAKTLLTDDRLGVALVDRPQKIVLDFSAPNVAKPMHVGHIRSTIIGDCLSRIATFLGHDVIRDNHIGDWGTQFGMVIWAWKKELNEEALSKNPLNELLRLYRLANGLKTNESIKEEFGQELVKLQSGDTENLAIWKKCVELSKDGLNEIYQRLDVENIPSSLIETGIAKESEGAIGVFSDDSHELKKDPFKIHKDGEWIDIPMLIQKSNGGFNYATTDIATIDYRLTEWKAEHIWYVVDVRQGLHFRQLFQVAHKRHPAASLDLQHISFGTILGKDRKPLKTRAGDLPQLADVLQDAVDQSREVLEEKSSDLPEDEKQQLAETIGIGAVKFTELSHHRSSDYIFDLDKMVALEGDTAPYLQYSYVRVQSIFRKLDKADLPDFRALSLELTEEGEINLARQLLKFGEVVPSILDDFRPNLLALYLLELARAFHSFFEACPVLKSEGSTRDSRLALCHLTAAILKKGLGLLGIQVPERM